jgi:hypothetical protein
VFRVCAWCERLLGVVPPLTDSQLTHGICGECAQRIEREERRPSRSVIIVRRNSAELRDRLEALTAGLPDVVVRVDARVGDRRRGGRTASRERRRGERRRILYPSQVAAWRALGVVVVARVP